MRTEVQKHVPYAITERGTRARYDDSTVDLALELVARAGGKVSVAESQLASEGIPISRGTLETWVEHSFPQRYWQIRKDLGEDVSEDVAGRALERARRADEAQALVLEETIAKYKEISPDALPKAAQSLATAKKQDIEMSQLLRNKPTSRPQIDIKGTIASLERLGVVEKAIDAEVVDED